MINKKECASMLGMTLSEYEDFCKSAKNNPSPDEENIHDFKKIVKEITATAKEKNLIKPLADAFKDVPVNKEIHKGKSEYFYN